MAANYALAIPYPDWLAEVAADPIYGWAVSAWDRATAVKGS